MERHDRAMINRLTEEIGRRTWFVYRIGPTTTVHIEVTSAQRSQR